MAVVFRKFITAGEGEFTVMKTASLEEQKRTKGGLLQWVSSKSTSMISGCVVTTHQRGFGKRGVVVVIVCRGTRTHAAIVALVPEPL